MGDVTGDAPGVEAAVGVWSLSSSTDSCVKWNVASASNNVIFTVIGLVTTGGGRGGGDSEVSNGVAADC